MPQDSEKGRGAGCAYSKCRFRDAQTLRTELARLGNTAPQIFTRNSLANIADSAGFAHVETFPTMNGIVYQYLASAELAAGEKHVMGGRVSPIRRILSHMKALGLGWRHILLASGNTGEELTFVCRK